MIPDYRWSWLHDMCGAASRTASMLKLGLEGVSSKRILEAGEVRWRGVEEGGGRTAELRPVRGTFEIPGARDGKL